MRNSASLALLVAAALTSQGAADQAGLGPLERVLALARPAVVRVVAGVQSKVRWRGKEYEVASGATGTGFFVDRRGYVLTSAHVVQSVSDEAAQRKAVLEGLWARVADDLGLPQSQETRTQLLAAFEAEPPTGVHPRPVAVVVLQDGQRVPFEIKAFGLAGGAAGVAASGKDAAVLQVAAENAPTLILEQEDQAKVGDRVFLVGFPIARELADELERSVPVRPGTTIGSISSRRLLADGTSAIETDAAIAADSSGYPVLGVDGKVTALASGIDRSGRAFAIPSGALVDLLRQAGAENKSGPADLKYAEGLDSYWQGRYSLARDRFAEVIALSPHHDEARRLHAEAVNKVAAGQDAGPGLDSTALGALAVVVAGVCSLLIGGTLVAWRKRKDAAQAFPTPQALPTPEAPRVPEGSQTLMVGPPVGKREVVARPEPDGEGATVLVSRVVTARLVAVAGPTRGTFRVGTGVTIGRSAEKCDVVVPDGQVSTRHAWVGPEKGRIVMRDLGSTNGTFLNGQLDRPVSEAELRNGDRIILGREGRVQFQFEA